MVNIFSCHFKGLLRRFIKRELLEDIGPLHLIKIQVSEKKNWVRLENIDIGLGAESAIKVIFVQNIYILCMLCCLHKYEV